MNLTKDQAADCLVLAKVGDKKMRDIKTVVCMEECSELIQALAKELRGEGDYTNLVEEICDVTCMIEQIINAYEIDRNDISKSISYKLQRQILRQTLN